MKISCICRIASPRHEAEVVLYAIAAPQPLPDEELKKCSTWVEHAYKNGFFDENKGILVDHSHRDIFQVVGVYFPNEISDKHMKKYEVIVGYALQLSGLVREKLSKKEKAICLDYEPVAQLSQMIDKWILEELYKSTNIETMYDN